ncbi:MAG TPA: amidase family protein [Chloroflexota bacterium]|nr:amidase family protein [Chloroflexota bacterium]
MFRADETLARGEPVGPLHGVPITVKDNMAVAGLPCTSGTLGRAHWIPERDAPNVARGRCSPRCPGGRAKSGWLATTEFVIRGGLPGPRTS